MTFDIKRHRAAATAPIELVNGEGAPLTDDEGNVLSITVHGPGSKIWQQTDAEIRRRVVARVEKNRGKTAAALDGQREDQIYFLGRITVSLNGWNYPHPDGEQWASSEDMFRALYSDDELGYIRDHVYAESRDWGNFTKGSATN